MVKRAFYAVMVPMRGPSWVQWDEALDVELLRLQLPPDWKLLYKVTVTVKKLEDRNRVVVEQLKRGTYQP